MSLDCKITYAKVQTRKKKKKIPPKQSTKLVDKDLSDAQGLLVNTKSNVENKEPHISVRSQGAHSQKQRIKKESTFQVSSLHGHNANITCIDASKKLFVTGSQDTSIKLWDFSTGEEVKNLHGHTDTITCVKIIDHNESNRLYALLVKEDKETFNSHLKPDQIDFLFVSTSKDCSIKLWSLPQGSCIKSIYTYFPISAILLHHNVVFAGSVSGKLSAFHLISGIQLYDMLIHSDQITSIRCNGKFLLTSGLDGDLKLWKVKSGNGSNSLDQVDEMLELDLYKSLVGCQQNWEDAAILTAFFYEDKIVFANDLGNVYFIDCAFDQFSSCSLALDDTTVVDSICMLDYQLIISTFNVKTQTASVHVFNIYENVSYLTSFAHSGLPRVMCCAASRSPSGFFLLAGGSQLMKWKKVSGGKEIIDQTEVLVISGRPLIDLLLTDTLLNDKSQNPRQDIDESSHSEQSSLEENLNTESSEENRNTWWCNLL